jgi:hypothetical protein
VSETGIDRETLRAELGQLELRLVDRLAGALESKADAKVVEQHDARIVSLELSRAAREAMPNDLADQDKRITSLERFRYAVPSVAMVSLLVSAALTVFYFSHG